MIQINCMRPAELRLFAAGAEGAGTEGTQEAAIPHPLRGSPLCTRGPEGEQTASPRSPAATGSAAQKGQMDAAQPGPLFEKAAEAGSDEGSALHASAASRAASDGGDDAMPASDSADDNVTADAIPDAQAVPSDEEAASGDDGALPQLLSALAERYGGDASDPAGLLRALRDEDAADAAAARDRAEAAAQRARAAHAFAETRSRRWALEAAALRRAHPDFDLTALRGDPIFTLLLSYGVPMGKAWRAATVDAREREAAAAAEKAVTDNVRARGVRPPEAGGGAAPAFGTYGDAARLSEAEVRAVLARLDRHERVSFG